MLFKLALKNMKKSIKDYSIYFFTLVFAVAIFYIFNSLDSQTAILELVGCKDNMIQMLIMMLGYVSVFVSVILGFLIIYANNFLIKRRKKEIGLYLTLGMGKKQVSKILVIETVLIGIVSLGVGLLLGVGLGQLISVLAIKLFSADVSQYKFAFSQVAALKTVLYFAIIFVLVMLFNVIVLNKYKLIDLLNGAKKNEKIKIKGRLVTFIIFSLAMGVLGYAYYLLFHGALQEMNYKFAIMLLCGCVGTFLFFLSLSGFMLRIVEMNKKLYYKGLNMFVLKQVNSKVNTTVFSTTVISLLLLFTIGILACSMSLVSIFNNGIDNNNLADFTIRDGYTRYVYDENNNIQDKKYAVDLDAIKNDEKFDKLIGDNVQIGLYSLPEVTANSILSEDAKEKALKEFGEGSVDFNSPLDVMKKSDFDRLMKLYHQDDLIMDYSDNFMLTCNIESMEEYYQDNLNNNVGIEINGKTYTPVTNKMYKVAIQNSNGDSNPGTIIVPDKVLEGIAPVHSYIMGNYTEGLNKEDAENEFIEFIKSKNNSSSSCIMTKIDMVDSSVGVKVVVTFVGLYLGIIFAITSATILAIQQLSESSDNVERYKVLREIGADQKMINKSLFTQIGICFMIPLAVGIFHAYFGLGQVTKLLKLIGNINLGTNVLITGAFIVLIYGGYFLATYLCSKRIISED